jgi:OmpA-OmpF porin, OOP family
MNSKSKTRLLTASALLILQASLAWAQPSGNAVPAAAQSMGEVYKASTALPNGVSRVTVYQPGTGSEIGSLKVNGRYHASLHGGSFTNLCFAQTSSVDLAGRVVEPNALTAAQDGEKIKVPLKSGKEVIVRMQSTAAGRTTIEIVSPEVAKSALQNARLQTHTLSRVHEAVSCEPVVTKFETITLVSDVVFDYNKSDVASVSASGRAALDRLIERMVTQYGSFDKTQIEVIGYADPLGREAGNVRLSQQRAMNIKNHMIKNGIAADKITTEGRGATELIVSDCKRAATPQNIVCNVLNRRVMVRASVPVLVSDR